MGNEYVSVKEYANQHGITVQSVYKQIRSGQISAIEKDEAGKKVKYIKADAQQPDEEPGSAPARPGTGENETQEKIAEPEKSPLSIAVDLLGEQLKEKDKQIERLQAEIKEKDIHIREQAEKLTELLRNSQQLQAHAQHLLDKPQEPEIIIDQPEEPPTKAEPENKKQSFIARLFGIR